MSNRNDSGRGHRFEHFQLDRVVIIGLRLLRAELGGFGFGLRFYPGRLPPSFGFGGCFAFRLTGQPDFAFAQTALRV